MKKCLLFAAATLAGLASCSQNEIENINNPQDNAIQFGTYLGQSATTKGTETTTTSIQTSGFGVSAFYTGQNNFGAMQTATPDFMYDQKVEYSPSSGAWSYSPIKYWPTTQGDKLSFFAYAPYRTNENGISLKSENTSHAGAPTLSITLQSPDKMIDFVAASVIDAKHDNTTHNDKVTFNFLHEMTRVGIKAKVSEDVYNRSSDNAANKTKVVITGIKFDAGDKIYKSAIYTFSATSTGNNTKGTWEDFTTTTEAIDLSSILNLGEVKMANNKYTKGNAIALEGTDAVDLLNEASATNKKYLFLIPVENLASDAATATISYDIVTEDANLNKGYSCTSATKKVNLPAGTLAQGKAYTYTFVINVDEVELEAAVTNWDTETNGNATVDYPSTDVTASISGIQFPDGTNIGGVTEGNPDDID